MTFDEVFELIIPKREETIARFSGLVSLIEKYVRKFPTDENWLKLKQLADSDDFHEMEVVAHTLKGYAGNLGLETLFVDCSEVVKNIRENEFDKAKISIKKAIQSGTQIENYINQLD